VYVLQSATVELVFRLLPILVRCRFDKQLGLKWVKTSTTLADCCLVLEKISCHAWRWICYDRM